MATQSDVRRIALALPDVREEDGHFKFSVKRGEEWRALCWVWLERIHPKKARVPNAEVLALRTANLDEKEAMLLAEPERFFTEKHYDGYPAVMVRLPMMRVPELRALLTAAHAAQVAAPAKRAAKKIAPAKGVVAKRTTRRS